MINYEKLLEANDIHDVDYIDENGYFYRKYKPLNEYLTVGYRGTISYDEDGAHILYVKIQYLNYEKYLDETFAYNADFSRKLIGVNIDHTNFTQELAINEERKAADLYAEYKLDQYLFERKQHYLMSLYELNIHIKNLYVKRSEYYKQMNDINKALDNLRKESQDEHRRTKTRLS